MEYNKIQKCYINEAGKLEVEMSAESARDIYIVIKAFNAGYTLKPRNIWDSLENERGLGEFIASNFLSNEEDEKLVKQQDEYRGFFKVVEKKVREIIGW